MRENGFSVGMIELIESIDFNDDYLNKKRAYSYIFISITLIYPKFSR